MQSFTPLPPMPIDYFSPDAPSVASASTSRRTRVSPRRLASDPVTLTSTPTSPTFGPIPIQSTASAPIDSVTGGTSAGLETFTTSSSGASITPAQSPPSNSKRHSFRLSHLKRPQSATSPKERSFCRSATSPDILSPQACCAKGGQAACLKAGEKVLRKSPSSPDAGIASSKSRWHPTRRKSKNFSPTLPKISLPCPVSAAPLLSSPPPPPQRTRTQPYEAPYFFPAPGSPEAVDYVRRIREEKSGRPSSVPTSDSHFL